MVAGWLVGAGGAGARTAGRCSGRRAGASAGSRFFVNSSAALAAALQELEGELRQWRLWSLEPPSAAQLASEAPFCADTLAFEQWLQWVFIPQVNQLLATGAPLPGPCALRPMGEQAFVHLGRRQTDLLAVLARIDRHASTLVD
ncbi:MAG TPA: YqcC family protein [Pseudomonas pachastrellae]|nr:YqcC family protein [Halopseudomonas pachastrellae]